ncbi:MAG: response regulator transcription factor [Elusimicrobia bacterium]|nr:response regulator transcription factor [Elusimicrobiota bacterium]
MGKRTARIVIADERPGMGLAGALDALSGVTVCAEVGTASEAVEAVEEHAPDAIVVDISLARVGGLPLLKSLRKLHPELAIVAVAPEGGRMKAATALRSGARAFLLRDGASKAFLTALAAIHAGKPYVDRRIARERTVLRPRRKTTVNA